MVLTSLIALVTLNTPRPPGLTRKQIARLRTSGLHCIIAGYVPRGYKATKVEIHSARTDWTGYYGITYSRGKREFLVEMASDGIGDAALVDEPGGHDYYRKVHNRILGDVDVEILDIHHERHFGFDWIDLGRKKVPRFICVIGHYINGDEGLKIVKSLEWLPRD